MEMFLSELGEDMYSGMKMKDDKLLDIETVRKLVGENTRDTYSLLLELVNINSFSLNNEGISEVAEVITHTLSPIIPIEEKSLPNGGRVWEASNFKGKDPHILLVGHIDTVYPPEGKTVIPRIEGDFLYGPGVADMKGGITVMIQTVKILEKLDLLSKIPIKILINCDEELGSPLSGEYITAISKKAKVGLVFECGGEDGSVVVARRGLKRYHMELLGESGHSGNILKKKASAILEIAKMIIDIEEKNDPEKGISVNVGKMQGGITVNRIPDRASIDFEIRFWEEKVPEEIEKYIEEKREELMELSMEIQIKELHKRPVMHPTPKTLSLYKKVSSIASRLGMEIPKESRGGASDANLIIENDIPTLDGLGPIGMDDHSEHERIIEKSLYDRIELLVHLLWELN